MNVHWVCEAEQDRSDILDYIAEQDLAAAIKMDELFSQAARNLAQFPFSGKAGSVPGTRELIPHESYRLLYEIIDDSVWILALVHTAQQWPPARS
ncbi:type II toxin-antitoxin system RelE/ParE family toxin [Collimonas pratensis]|uniref:Addiction module toxin, RelE/StbE family protein n=1 Tax=Collimonas pratensis TaxID=279113 RepID=A0A127R420_9BURK|nr:type II toxin-antitoxin system RelE/ParE family toxin [Collimonas pratensis]AMP07457.1 addiction module toxin, RelE/StbE family protein [Collimonas pratensis]AMP17190.1 addiction module toxin, RelE/StbE family protein [Collimonas pratensis]NKI71406.1 type II toxin-antitoxin system mRNA interferase toxin, RelE/StbE family [Collimonas pratensis]